MALAAAAVHAEGWHLEAHAVQHSDALPLARFGDDDFAAALAPRVGRNLAYAAHGVALAADTRWGRFALLTRQQATLVASRGALELAADVETSGRPAGDMRWDVHLRYLTFGGNGLAWRGAGALAAPRWRWQAGVQALALERWREWHVQGHAGYAAAAGRYSAELQGLRAEERLEFPYQRPFASRGAALLFDGEVAFATETGHGLCLGVRDLGRLHWRGLPRSELTLSTDTQGTDADGFVVYRPLLQGHNRQDRRRRGVPAWLTLDGHAALPGGWRAEAGAERLQGFGWLPQLGLAWQGGDWRGGAVWRVHERRLTLQLGWRALRLTLGTDRLDAKARSQELALAAAWPL